MMMPPTRTIVVVSSSLFGWLVLNNAVSATVVCFNLTDGELVPIGALHTAFPESPDKVYTNYKKCI